MNEKEVGKILERQLAWEREKRERLNYIRNVEKSSEHIFQGLTVVLGHLGGRLS